MFRAICILAWLLSPHSNALALDIWCAVLAGGRPIDTNNFEAKIKDGVAWHLANAALRRPFDVETVIRAWASRNAKATLDCSEAVFTGKIEASDVAKVGAFLHGNPWLSTVYLSSPGGNMAAAIQIGRLFRSRSIATAAPNVGDGRSLSVFSDAAHDGSWQYLDRADVSNSNFWRAQVCSGQDCLCASACFIAWAGGIERDGDALGLHRPTLQDEYLIGATPQEAQYEFREAVRKARVYLAEMEVPEFYIEKMFGTPKEKMYVVGDDASEWDADKALSYRGMLGYPPSIKDWVEATCRLASWSDQLEMANLVESGATSQNNARVRDLNKSIGGSLDCEWMLWISARQKNAGN